MSKAAEEQWAKFMSTLTKYPDKIRLVRAFDQITSTTVTAIVRDRVMKGVDSGKSREDSLVVAIIHDDAPPDRFLLEHPAKVNCFLYPNSDRELNICGSLKQPSVVKTVIPKRW